MAVDATLLETAVTQDLATFRWYRWARPTLSLGYFQQAAEIETDPRLAGLPWVRRLTGGGAILHDQEWTYSLAIPAQQTLCGRPEELYDLVHHAIGEVLRAIGYPLLQRGEAAKLTPEPVLCFSRRDAHDLVYDGKHKVLGSAQRRRKGAILQHGSLLLRASPRTPQHLGLEDFRPTIPALIEALRQVPRRLAEQVFDDRLSTREIERARSVDQDAPP